ncbi:unnamed protein product [Medioppia subpectinata]|uniref:Uncharacterized protein n=1 Tax=Medioppia subpectinata TaxID=1979941 RepID=A0A7R9PX94_9ACAR|nr:unnamed protein product [Medioppia subpectinata]CAG2104776.1 unnamed protein product [Medioppia subpectinata]
MDNPLCDPKITIDSAFVDIYSDLGSDVITLFADNTVYQLTVKTTDPINPSFRYKRSQTLKKQMPKRWYLWAVNKTIIYSDVLLNETENQLNNHFIGAQHGWLTLTIDYMLNGSLKTSQNWSDLIGLLNTVDDNKVTIDEIEGYLSQTTAGFAFNDYFYLFAGNRVCRMHNTTLRFDDNCLNQSIAQWIGCKDMRTDPKDIDDLGIESKNKSKISETKSLTEMSSLDENRPIDLKITTTTSAAVNKTKSQTNED